MEIKRVEELLAAKESERSEILEQYRALSSDADRYQAVSQQLESETSAMKMQLLTKESDLRRVREQLEQLQVDLSEVLHSLNSSMWFNGLGLGLSFLFSVSVPSARCFSYAIINSYRPYDVQSSMCVQQQRVQQKYELQLSTLTKSIAELEEILQQSALEKNSLLRDLQAIRDLCARLENSRDSLQRQLTTKTLEKEQANHLHFYIA